MKKIEVTPAYPAILTLVVWCALALNPADASATSNASELLDNNCIYQYKTEPIYDPRSNKSFLLWLGKTGDIYGREYNHETKAWNPPLSQESKKIIEFTRTPADRHNYPSVAIAANGHVLVFQADHLKGDDGYGLMLYTSPKPGSIDGEWSSRMLWTEGQPAYPTAVTAGNSVYLFMRRKVEDVWRVWQYSKSGDHGKTWTEPRTILDTEDLDDGKPGYQPEGFDEVYSVGKKFYDPVNKRIALTWFLAGDVKHNLFNKDIYLAYLNTNDDLMYAPTGANLGKFVSHAEMKDPKTKVMVVETEPQPGEKTPPLVDCVNHANYLPDGKFFVTYNNMSKLNKKQSLMWARWTGKDWRHGTIEEKPFKDALSRYGSVQQVSGKHFRISIIDEELFKVRIKETQDAGETWTQVCEEVLDTKGRALNSADFIVPYRPGYPQIMVTTCPPDDRHNTNPSGDFPIWALGDGIAK